MNVWDRQDGEPDDAWTAFVEFRDSKPPRRVMRVGGVGLGKATVSKWARDHQWFDRAAAWDRHLDQIRQRELEGLQQQNAQEVSAEHKRILQNARELADREIEKYLAASKTSDMPGMIKASELIKLMEQVVKLDRLTRGDTTENHGVEVDLSNLTPEELRQFLDLSRKAGNK